MHLWRRFWKGIHGRVLSVCLTQPGTPLITELIVVADKAAIWELTDNKDCVGKIKSATKGRDDKQGTVFPIRQKESGFIHLSSDGHMWYRGFAPDNLCWVLNTKIQKLRRRHLREKENSVLLKALQWKWNIQVNSFLRICQYLMLPNQWLGEHHARKCLSVWDLQRGKGWRKEKKWGREEKRERRNKEEN